MDVAVKVRKIKSSWEDEIDIEAPTAPSEPIAPIVPAEVKEAPALLKYNLTSSAPTTRTETDIFDDIERSLRVDEFSSIDMISRRPPVPKQQKRKPAPQFQLKNSGDGGGIMAKLAPYKTVIFGGIILFALALGK